VGDKEEKVHMCVCVHECMFVYMCAFPLCMNYIRIEYACKREGSARVVVTAIDSNVRFSDSSYVVGSRCAWNMQV